MADETKTVKQPPVSGIAKNTISKKNEFVSSFRLHYTSQVRKKNIQYGTGTQN